MSCFKQIKVTNEMKEKDKDLTRSYIQKGICLVAEVPLFGSLMSKLEPITKAYFQQENFKDNEVKFIIYSCCCYL